MNKENLLTELKLWKETCDSRKFCSDVREPKNCEYIDFCYKTCNITPCNWEVDKIDER